MSTGTATLADRLRDHAAPLVDGQHTPAVVVGAVQGEQSSLVCLGETAKRGGRPNGPTVSYELGSLSKTFTALLLADMVTRDEVSYADAVATLLPTRAVPASVGGLRITLLDLATHTAGLPRTPGRVYLRMLHSGWRDPYGAYTTEHLYRTTARMTPRRPGEFKYSSVGYGLLGQVLANVAGTPFPQLLTERVLHPLTLTGTTAQWTPDTATHAAVGHRRGKPTPPWRFQALAGAGAVRATGEDMLRYLQAQLHPDNTPLAEALRAAQTPQRPGRGGMVCLSWFTRTMAGTPLYWHEGGTAGFTAYAGFAPERGVGVFVLANSMTTRRQAVLHTARRAFKDLLA